MSGSSRCTDWASGVGAKLIPFQGLSAWCKKAPRIENVVANEIVGDPMELVRTGFDDNVRNGASIAELRGHVGSLNFELLNFVDAGTPENATTVFIGIVRAINEEKV
jgi:hypothetical protein